MTGALRGRPDGAYTMAIRPHHVTPRPESVEAVEVAGEVLVAELSGSESIVHFNLQGHPWVSQSHGIHPFKVGESATLFIDSRQCLYFDADERLVEEG